YSRPLEKADRRVSGFTRSAVLAFRFRVARLDGRELSVACIARRSSGILHPAAISTLRENRAARSPRFGLGATLQSAGAEGAFVRATASGPGRFAAEQVLLTARELYDNNVLGNDPHGGVTMPPGEISVAC